MEKLPNILYLSLSTSSSTIQWQKCLSIPISRNAQTKFKLLKELFGHLCDTWTVEAKKQKYKKTPICKDTCV